MSKNKKKRTNKKSAKQTKAKKSLAKKADSIPKASSDGASAKQTAEEVETTQSQAVEKPSDQEEENQAQKKAEKSKSASAPKAFDSPKKLPVPKRKTSGSQASSTTSSKSSEKPEKAGSDALKKEKGPTSNSPFIVVPEKPEDKVKIDKIEKKPVPKRITKPTTPPPSEKPTKAAHGKDTSSEVSNDLEDEPSKKTSQKNQSKKTPSNDKKPDNEKANLGNAQAKKETEPSTGDKNESDQEQNNADAKVDVTKAATILASLDKTGDKDKAADNKSQEKKKTNEQKVASLTSHTPKKETTTSGKDAEDSTSIKEASNPADSKNASKKKKSNSILEDKTSETAPEESSTKKNRDKSTEADLSKNAATFEKDEKTSEDRTTEKSISIAPPADKDQDLAKEKDATKDNSGLEKESSDKITSQEIAPSTATEVDSTATPDQTDAVKKEGSGEPLIEEPEESQGLRSKLRSSPRRRYLLATAAVFLGFYVVLTSAWAFDSARHSGRAPRGAHIGDVNVSGMKEADVEKETKKFAAQLDEKTITLKADEASVKVSPTQLGAEVDTEALTAAAFKNNSEAILPVRPIKWLGNVFSAKSVVIPEYNIDEKELIKLTDELLGSQIEGPKEPGIALINNKLDATTGESGKELVTTNLLGDVETAISQGKPATINLSTTVAEPKVTLETAKKLASEADKVTDEPIALTALDQKIQVSPKTLKKWIAVAEVDEEQTWIIDQEIAADELNDLFGTLGVAEDAEDEEVADGDEAKEPLKPAFTVVNNKPILLPVADTITCCDDTTAAKIKEILLSEPTAPKEVTFPKYETMADQCKRGKTRGNVDTSEEVLRQGEIDIAFIKKDPEYEKLNAYGIVEEISTCTTAHTGGNRSVNIKNFAASMKGKVIEPQSQISLNEEVGERTRKKGYLPAGGIEQGKSSNTIVGGGISQFAATFFNASFFGGLDLIAFQPHSQYFDRYPFVLESTISWGGPEVISGNPTDYGVLVWTEFTSSTVTVTFYSTKSVEVEASEPKRWTRGICKVGSVERTIDGVKDKKEIVAEYTQDGYDCNGNPTPGKQQELAEEAARRQEAARPQPTPAPPSQNPQPNPNPTPPSNPFIEN